MPDLGDGRLRAVERDDRVERVVVGALRAEVTSSRVTFADDRFASPIIGATRASAGWVFLAADGAVARAESFLGPLQPLGHAPRPPRNMTYGPLPASCGRAAVAAPTSVAGLWTTDGSAAIAPARGAPPGVVLSAAFADADHGMIAVDGGELFITRDRGASFARVDLGEAAAASVRCERGELHVMTSSGLKIFDRDGRPTRAAPPGSDLDASAGRRMTCTASQCAIDDRAGVAWHRSPGASNHRVLASSAGHADPRAPSTAWPCTYQQADLFAPRLEEGVAYVTDARGRRHYRRRGPDVALRVAVTGRLDVTQFELDWPGSRHAADPMVVRGEYNGFHMGRAIRKGARKQVVWIPRAGRPAPGVNAWEAIDDVLDVLPLPDGTVAVLFKLHQEDERSAATYQRLVVVRRDGKPIAQRTFRWHTPWAVVDIAFFDGIVGAQSADGDPARPHWFFPVRAADPKRSLPRLDLEPIPVCTMPSRRGAVSIRLAKHPVPSSKASFDLIRRVHLRHEVPACIEAYDEYNTHDWVESGLEVNHNDHESVLQGLRCAEP